MVMPPRGGRDPQVTWLLPGHGLGTRLDLAAGTVSIYFHVIQQIAENWGNEEGREGALLPKHTLFLLVAAFLSSSLGPNCPKDLATFVTATKPAQDVHHFL